ncbi:MAG: hypothetical protein U9Q22_05410 [Candidatus Altiarchaeota archaeon]|nr:hypothetical protein [Candidatus Altiarchaeota archaeon]
MAVVALVITLVLNVILKMTMEITTKITAFGWAVDVEGRMPSPPLL